MQRPCLPAKSDHKEGNHELQPARAIDLKDRCSTLNYR